MCSDKYKTVKIFQLQQNKKSNIKIAPGCAK